MSTAQQDAGSQRLAILEYARRPGASGLTTSSRLPPRRAPIAKHRRLDQLMAVLEPGDRLVVSELSRLGRSLGEVVALPRCDCQSLGGLRRRQGEHPLRGPSGPPDQGHDHPVRAVRRSRTRPSSPNEPAKASRKPGRPGRSWGDRRDRWVSRASTAGKTRSVTSSTSECRRAPSPRSPASPARRSTTSSPPER